MILGHHHPAVIAAVRRRARCRAVVRRAERGWRREFAEVLVGALPWVESIRIGLTGTEMDLLAVRIARAATGRQRRRALRRSLPRLARPAVHRHGGDAGAVRRRAAHRRPIGGRRHRRGRVRVERPRSGGRRRWRSATSRACVMEPVMCNIGLIAPAAGYLEGVKALCARARRAARHRRGDHRLPPRPDRRPGLPRHPR